MAKLSDFGRAAGHTHEASDIVASVAQEAERMRQAIRDNVSRYRANYARRAGENGERVVRELVKDRYALGRDAEQMTEYADAWIFPTLHAIREGGSHAVFYGPPGTGKSYFVGSLAERCGAYVMHANAEMLATPIAFEAAVLQARIIRKISMEEWIDGCGGPGPSGFDNALRMIENLLMAAIVPEGGNRAGLEGEVRAFVRANITTIDALVQLCMPDNENDCERINSLAGDFEKRFGSKKAAEILGALARHFPGIPVIFFIDEIDKVGGRQLGSNPVLNALFSAIDGGSERRTNTGVTFIGATNDTELLDHALIRKGRMDLVLVSYPDADQRKAIGDVMAARFSEFGLRVESGIAELFAGVPMITGADIHGILNSVARALRLRRKGTEEVTITREDILKHLESAEPGKWLSRDPALSLDGYGRVLGSIRKEPGGEPFLLMAYQLMSELKAQLIEHFSEKAYMETAPAKATQDELYEMVLRYSFPGIRLLRSCSELLAVGYTLREGVALRTPSEALAEWVVEETQKRILDGGRPIAVTNVHADRLLYGIVGTTRKNADALFAKLATMRENLIVLRNLDALMVGDYVGEWSGAVCHGIATLKRKGATIIGCGTIPYFDSAFDAAVHPAFTHPEAVFLASILNAIMAGRAAGIETSQLLQVLTARGERETVHSAQSVLEAARSGEVYDPPAAKDYSDVFARHHARVLAAADDKRRRYLGRG